MPHRFVFLKFEQDQSICIASLLDTYLQYNLSWRHDNQKEQLLLSFIVSTTVGWVKQVLKNSGVDISQIKAHSTRSAATSKVGRLRFSVEDILVSLLGKDKYEETLLRNAGTLPTEAERRCATIMNALLDKLSIRSRDFMK